MIHSRSSLILYFKAVKSRWSCNWALSDGEANGVFWRHRENNAKDRVNAATKAGQRAGGRPGQFVAWASQLVGMTTRLSNHIRGVLKTFGLLPGAMRGLPFDRKVEALLLNRSDVALIVRPMLVAWRQLREQIFPFLLVTFAVLQRILAECERAQEWKR